MTDDSQPSFTEPHTEPGIANAEDGLVVLDGPNGLAVTMTAEAATATGRNLIAAAEVAERQMVDREAERQRGAPEAKFIAAPHSKTGLT